VLWLFLGAGNADLAAVQFDDHFDDGETKAEAIGAARGWLRDLVEAFKNALLLFRGDTGTCVAYL
jgi:hypothetical protein